MVTPVRLTQLTDVSPEADKPPPSEFRIFRAGPNYSDRGPDPFVFDDVAAASVMAEYRRQGNRLMIDVAHASTDEQAIVARADATDAMCYYDLEVRNGELWGVNAEWTPDGVERLRRKTQRFLSPTFCAERSDGGRITELLNVALVSRAGLRSAVDVAASAKLLEGKTKLRAAILAAIVKGKA